jgi:deazaflavin-dependent oxidoreductase (nitroreductase family)
MDELIRRALGSGQVIDITTTGRVTGQPRRIEIVFHNFDSRIYITGMPRADRTRAWLHNLGADPRLTVHLKSAVRADLSATARIIDDPLERRSVLSRVAPIWRQDVDAMVAHSPLIEVEIEGYPTNRDA